jgi:uncharacterized protein (TIGR00369 family)
MSETEFLEMGRQVLKQQPFSQLLGASLTSFTPGNAELTIPVRDELRQQNGFVHGGVLSYAADNALTFAGGSALAKPVVTAEYKINYLRPAVGDSLIAHATAIYTGSTQAVCRCDIFVVNGDKKILCATAQGTIAVLRDKNEA